VHFHLLFWASRPLPNVFATILINYAMSCWINGWKPITVQEKMNEFLKAQRALAVMGAPPASLDYTTKRKGKGIESQASEERKKMVWEEALRSIKSEETAWIRRDSWNTLVFAIFASLVFR
jgi:hypothetical protein